MLSFSQLEFLLPAPVVLKPAGRDAQLEALASQLFIEVGAETLAVHIKVEWSKRLRSAAGRADGANRLVLLNPRLADHGEEELQRTLRHELAHLLAHFRAGRRRIAPHGPEWRRACADLGIPDESRCHTLPFPIQRRARPYLYICTHCGTEFPRTRPLKRTSACLACCRAHNRGKFDPRFRLRLVRR